MEDNKTTIKECLRIMVDSIRTLEQAKDDCDVVCTSAWDALLESDPSIEEKNISQKELLEIAKSIAKRKLKKLEEKHEAIGILLDEISVDKDGEDDE